MMVTMIPMTIITGTVNERDVDPGKSFSGAFSAFKSNVIIRLSLTTNLTYGDIQNKGITVSSTIVS